MRGRRTGDEWFEGSSLRCLLLIADTAHAGPLPILDADMTESRSTSAPVIHILNIDILVAWIRVFIHTGSFPFIRPDKMAFIKCTIRPTALAARIVTPRRWQPTTPQICLLGLKTVAPHPSYRGFATTKITLSANKKENGSKVFRTADLAVADIQSGSTILSSGFGLCGVAGKIDPRQVLVRLC